MPHPPRACVTRHAPRPLRSFFVVVVSLAVAAAAVRAQSAGAAGGVRLVVTVTDGKGRHVNGLDKSHFSVLEGKVERQITVFESADRPAGVGVLVDMSGSMARWRDEIKIAVEQLVLGGHPENQYFVAEFNTQGNMLTDWTSDAGRLSEAILQIGGGQGKARAKGLTALHDACAAALAKLAEGTHAKRVLVVVSDGQDNASRTTSFGDLRRKIREGDVLIYCLGPVDRKDPSVLDTGGQALLEEIAAQSGGRAFFPETRAEASDVGGRIAVELRRQYVVGFAPGEAGASEPKWRKIKIKVAPPTKEVKGIVARSREGYFFPRAKG